MAYDCRADMKKKTMKDLFALRDRFSKFLKDQEVRGFKFPEITSCLAIIEVEIASRIGSKGK